MAEFLTQAAFARLRGVSKATVNGWKKRGYIQFGPGGKLVDVAATEKVLADRPPVYRGGVTKPARPTTAQLAQAPDWSLAESTRRRQAAMAALAELELQIKRNEVIRVADYRMLLGQIAIAARNMMLSWPSRFAFDTPSLTAADVARGRQMVENDLHDMSWERGYGAIGKGDAAPDDTDGDDKDDPQAKK
jgi:phage terminase Nu1 subunit (DNA packaging protein)